MYTSPPAALKRHGMSLFLKRASFRAKHLFSHVEIFAYGHGRAPTHNAGAPALYLRFGLAPASLEPPQWEYILKNLRCENNIHV